MFIFSRLISRYSVSPFFAGNGTDGSLKLSALAHLTGGWQGEVPPFGQLVQRDFASVNGRAKGQKRHRQLLLELEADKLRLGHVGPPSIPPAGKFSPSQGPLSLFPRREGSFLPYSDPALDPKPHPLSPPVIGVINISFTLSHFPF